MVYPSTSASDADNLVFTRSCKRRSRKQSRKKWKRSDSSDSDSVALMTPLTTPIFDFHLVIRAVTTSLRTPTPLLVKTSLKGEEC